MLTPAIILTGVSTLLFVAYSFYKSLKKVRARYNHVPGLTHSTLWGHLLSMGAYIKDDRHIDYHLVNIWKDIGRPPFFFLDAWPLMSPNVAVIADAELAEHLFKATPKRPYSYPKGAVFDDMLSVIGANSLLSADGEKWKSLRRRYNPGFNPRYLQSFLPDIVAEAEVFVSKLDAAKGQTVTLGEMTTSLTIDVICTVILGHSIKAQTSPSDLAAGFKGCLDWQIERERLNPFHLYNPFRPLATLYYEGILNRAIDREIQTVFRQRGDLKARSVLALTIGDLKGDTLSAEELSSARDQIKTFLLAGFDTTSSALQWTYYELSRHPKVLSKLREEHRSIFGSDDDGYNDRVAEMFTNQPEKVLQQMTYTTAVFKESLRFHPVAAATKSVEPGTNLAVTNFRTGKEHLLDGHLLVASQSVMNIDERWWGPQAEDFIPERFLEGAEWKIPPFAFRPFERGPRACIGPELVYLEAKVILALTARRFAFDKVFDGKYKELYNIRKITAKPNDGMRMRVASAT